MTQKTHHLANHTSKSRLPPCSRMPHKNDTHTQFNHHNNWSS